MDNGKGGVETEFQVIQMVTFATAVYGNALTCIDTFSPPFPSQGPKLGFVFGILGLCTICLGLEHQEFVTIKN